MFPWLLGGFTPVTTSIYTVCPGRFTSTPDPIPTAGLFHFAIWHTTQVWSSGVVKPISVRFRQPILIFCNRCSIFDRYCFWCLPISPISVKNICLYRWKKLINIGWWRNVYQWVVNADIVYITITDFTDIRWYRYTNIGHQYRLVSMTDIACIQIRYWPINDDIGC